MLEGIYLRERHHEPARDARMIKQKLFTDGQQTAEAKKIRGEGVVEEEEKYEKGKKKTPNQTTVRRSEEREKKSRG